MDEKRHQWNIEKNGLHTHKGLYLLSLFAIEALTKPGDNIILQTPSYDPFYTIIEDNHCIVRENPLIYKDKKYYIDFDDLENKVDENTKLMIICSPHNPLGRVWTKSELEKLGNFCLKHNIKILCDEIHSEIIFSEAKHTALATISKEIEDISIIFTSPTKAFNIAGLQVANVIIKNEDLRNKFRHSLNKYHFLRPSIFGVEGLIAAYDKSEYWLKEVTSYIEANRDFFIDYVEKNMPLIQVSKPEGAYVLWVDFSQLKLSIEELNNFLQDECRLATIDGSIFGEKGQQFQRINIACPRSTLVEALDRIETGLKNRNLI